MKIDYLSIQQFWAFVSLKKSVQADVKLFSEKLAYMEKRRETTKPDYNLVLGEISYGKTVIKEIDIYMSELASKSSNTCLEHAK